MTDTEAVLVASHEGITWITLNRPDRMNTIDDSLIEGLNRAWREFSANDDRCAVLVGKGPKAFCAGADLNSFGGEMWEAVPNVGVPVAKPIVAAVHGYCVGGGCVIMSFCDLVVAADNSQFWYPEAQVGLTGGVAAGIASRIPLKFATEFLLLGERLSAQDALRIGLVNRVVDETALRDTAEQLAGKLANSAPLVVQTLKQLMLSTLPRSPLEQAGIARAQLRDVLDSEDRAEGMRAFREKRTPKFTGR